ncbi:serine hydrolase [Actinocorallia longicatena]|uniref:Beta-lactamase class A catalytic domain-containing protein n=1 Tax=Actinocorallia longicatena TaxID=111803 RepID=A0ABP6PYB6_9ACTN
MLSKIVLVVPLVLAAACSAKAPSQSEMQVPVPAPAAAASPSLNPCLKPVADKKARAKAKRDLTDDLASYARSRPGRVTAYAVDLESGASVGYHQNSHDQITASGAKIEILVTLLRQARADHRGLSGSERSLATDMITQSDNKAADALYGRIGGGSGVASTYRKLHMNDTDPGPSIYWGGTTTSPADRVKLVTALAEDGHGLHADDRGYALGLMRKVVKDQKWGVSAAARPGDEVALKNGWTPRPFVHDTWAVTSTGLVTGPGRTYALSILTDVQPGEGSGITTIEHISDMVEKRMPALSATVEKPC